MIPIYKPYLPKDSLKYAYDAIESGWISSIGDYKNIASNKLCKTIGCEHSLLLSNGTVATHLLIKAVKYRFPTANKVIVPNNVYVAAYNSLLYDGLNDFTIYPVDANLLTWNADYSELPIEPDSNTIFLIVHNLGNIVNVPSLKKKYPTSIFIEDNCEGLFGEYENKSSGTESLCSSISFFGNKNITTGEGGAILTNDKGLFDYLNKLQGQGQTNVRFIHDVLGYNYRMTNIHAAILLGQMELYYEIKNKKIELFNKYRENLSGLSGIHFQMEEPSCSHSLWMFGIRIEGSKSYESARVFFEKYGIETRPLFYPISHHTHLKHIPSVNTNAALLNNECVIFPSYPELKDAEIEYICDIIKKYYALVYKNN
jgi:perosamine synthetase